jgi:hypothetical protein
MADTDEFTDENEGAIPTTAPDAQDTDATTAEQSTTAPDAGAVTGTEGPDNDQAPPQSTQFDLGPAQRKMSAIVESTLQHLLSSYGISSGGPQGNPLDAAKTAWNALPAQDWSVTKKIPGALAAADTTAANVLGGPLMGDLHRRLTNFLRGSNAMDPQTQSALVNAVDPNNIKSPNQQSLDTLEYATEKAGPAAAAALMQGQVQKYDALRFYAANAVGAGNIGSAVDAANRAFKNLPVEESIHFEANHGNVTATVTDPDGQPQAYTLNPTQFQKLLGTQNGLGYSVLVHGPHAAMQALGATAGVSDQTQAQPQPAAPDAEDRTQAEMMHPGGGWAERQKQNEFMVAQKQQREARAHQLQVEREKGENLLRVAQTRGTASENVANTRGAATVESAKIGAEGREKMWDIRGVHGENIQRIRQDAENKRFDQKMKNDMMALGLKMSRQSATDQEKTQGGIIQSAIKGMTAQGQDLDTVFAELKKQGVDVHGIFGQTQPTRAPAAPVVNGATAPQTGASPSGQNVRRQIGVKATGEPVYANQ